MIVVEDWLLTAQRAAIHRPSASAVVADVHLGYGDARRRGGDAVPLPDAVTSLDVLQPLVNQHGLRQLIIAGDLFEAGASEELVDALMEWCEERQIDLAVVPGNHDRGIGKIGTRLSLHPDGVTLGRWRVVHGDGTLPDGAFVQGHEHPWARWSRRVGGPCFLVSANRLILPAFSRDAAGVNVIGDARWDAFRCFVIAGERVLDFGEMKGLKRKRNA
jgi:putative SbcD/Mre11-related phosphoesterase